MQNRYEEINSGRKFISEEKHRRKLETAMGNIIARQYESINSIGTSYTVQVPLSKSYTDELEAYGDPNIERFASLIGGRDHISDDESGRYIIRTLSRNGNAYAIEFRILPDKLLSLPDASDAEMRNYKTNDRTLAALCKECIQRGGEKPRGISPN